MKVVVIGPVGSGKSTQAELISKFLHLPHLSTGELFREEIKKNSKLGKLAKPYIDKGELVPDEIFHKILTKEILNHDQGFVLDGSPRTINQAKSLPFKVDKAIYLRVSDKETTQRLIKRGRRDDDPGVVTKRLSVYHQETEPIVKYYREQGVLLEIDGERSIEDIFADIVLKIR